MEQQLQKLKCEFTGHVVSKDTSGGYDSKFEVTDEKLGVKYVQHLGLLVSSKKVELTQMVQSASFVGSKVHVEFYVTGIAGVGKSSGKQYQINKLMVSKMTIIAPGVATDGATEGEGEPDMPF